jgi:hypothetical protein
MGHALLWPARPFQRDDRDLEWAPPEPLAKAKPFRERHISGPIQIVMHPLLS